MYHRLWVPGGFGFAGHMVAALGMEGGWGTILYGRKDTMPAYTNGIQR